jgi:hypothetical protein
MLRAVVEPLGFKTALIPLFHFNTEEAEGSNTFMYLV